MNQWFLFPLLALFVSSVKCRQSKHQNFSLGLTPHAGAQQCPRHILRAKGYQQVRLKKVIAMILYFNALNVRRLISVSKACALPII